MVGSALPVSVVFPVIALLLKSPAGMVPGGFLTCSRFVLWNEELERLIPRQK